MTNEIIDRVVIEIAKTGNKSKPEVHFFGGEPLLRFPQIEYAVPRFIDAGVRAFSITTNASLLTPEISRFLRENNFSVLVSFDGARDAQNDRKKGSYEHLIPKIKTLLHEYLDRPVHVSVNAVVTKRNIKYLASSVKELVEIGFRRIALSCEFDPREEWGDQELDEMPKQWRELTNFSIQHFRDHGWLPLNKLDANTEQDHDSTEGCALVNGKSLSVHPNGDLSTCLAVLSSRISQRDKNAFKTGNILEGMPDTKLAGLAAKRHIDSKTKVINIIPSDQYGRHTDRYGCPLSVITAKSNAYVKHFETWASCVEEYKSKIPRRQRVFGVETNLLSRLPWHQ